MIIRTEYLHHIPNAPYRRVRSIFAVIAFYPRYISTTKFSATAALLLLLLLLLLSLLPLLLLLLLLSSYDMPLLLPMPVSVPPSLRSSSCPSRPASSFQPPQHSALKRAWPQLSLTLHFQTTLHVQVLRASSLHRAPAREPRFLVSRP